MSKKIPSISVMLFALAALVMVGCKKDFDQPPGPTDQPIVANTTIASLKALHTIFGQLDRINDDIIISGLVTANDKSGNLYKEIYLEDSTGAIKIMLDATGLFASYPVGRRLYVYCKGLYISDDNGLMQLGTRAVVGGVPSMEGILGNDIPNYIKGGSINNPVVPTVVTVAQLGTGMQNPFIGRLVKLEGFEFAPRDTFKTYSDTSVYKNDQNDTIQDCNNVKTIIRTSAYADFAALSVPKGNGDVTAIYTVYRTTKQFVIRDTSDVKFTNPRCGALPPGTIVLLDENFETQTVPNTAPYNPVTITGWNNLPQAGGKYFDGRTFGGNKYAYLSAFGSNQSTVTTWLVTKGVNLNNTVNEVLNFKTMQGFITSGGVNVESALKVLISTNYSGTGNPWDPSVTWNDITTQVALSPGSTTSSFPATFTPSGNVDLNGYSGTLYVAFRYEGADLTGAANDKTSAWEVDDVRIYGY